jgi:glycerol uptake facilitator-like aquaporin
LLVAAVVGSGIMAERLFPETVGLALLANSLATGAALVALVLALADISGAHFNPAVSLSEFLNGRLPARHCAAYVAAQIAGGLSGVVVAHAMFGARILQVSVHARAGLGLWVSEAIATFGLLLVIAGAARTSRSATAIAVGAYITAAYWFTSSTSFANPAVTIARAFTESFAGIRPTDVPAFLAAEAIGSVAAVSLIRWLRPPAALGE